jgi:hypothetical protein
VPAEPKPTWSEPEVLPVDRDDEPLFTQAPTVIPEVTAEESQDSENQYPENQDQVEAAAEAKDFAEPPQAEDQPKTEDIAKAEEQPKSEDQPKTECLAEAEVLAKEDQPKPEEIAQEAVVAAVVEEADAFVEHAPTEEELTEALRLLTPQHEAVPEPTAMTSAPEEAVPVAAGTAALESTAPSAGTRWVAEAVSLSTTEAALSLEAEMFRTLAPPSITTPGPVAAEEMAPVSAVEVISPVAEEAAPTGTTETPEMATSAAAEESRANPEDSRKQVAEEPATATFALHYTEAEAASAVESLMQTAEETPAGLEAEFTAPQESQESSSEAAAEGEESMGRDGKTGKAGKSGWHQIRATPASAAATGDVVEAKQAEPEAEAAPKAMAAAAAADGASAASAVDASAIASIVDSVLADLRPKIVEEIARKLAGK